MADKIEAHMALVVSYGNGRATNALNHATDGPVSDNVSTAPQLQAIEASARALAQVSEQAVLRSTLEPKENLT